MAAALLVMGTTTAYQLLHDGWRSTARAIDRVEIRTETVAVRNWWRTFVRDTDPDRWTAAGRRFDVGGSGVRWEPGALVRIGPDGKETGRLAVSRHVSAVFTVERGPGLVPAAVLTIAWDERPGTRRPVARSVRIVACPQPATPESAVAKEPLS